MELAKICFARTLQYRLGEYIYTVKGKDRGKSAWHYIIVDWDKKDQFLQKIKTGSIDVEDYGKILGSGWGHGHDIQEGITEKVNKISADIAKNFFVHKFGTGRYVQTCYVLSDAGKEIAMEAASSVEDIRHNGRILISSFDEDPPEALAYILESKLFGLKVDVDLNIDSRFDEVLNGELHNVQEYLNSGLDIDCTDNRGWTLLHHFAYCGNVNIVSFLKRKGANIHVQDKICGRKPVHIAAREGHGSVVEFFLKNGAVVNEADRNNWTLLHYAAWKGNVTTVKLLIENNAEIKVKELTDGKMPVHIAAKYGHKGVVEALLENSRSIEDGDNCDRTPLYYATLMRHLETAKFLIDKGADIHKKTKLDTMPIHAAVTYKNNEVLDLLLSFGVNIDEPGNHGNTPLHCAVSIGCLDVVQFLINKKANLNIVNNSSKRPIDLCKENTDLFLHLADRMVTMFQAKEKYREALQYCREMLEIQKNKFGPNHPETLKTHHQEARVLYKQGQYEAAVSKFKSTLEARERWLGSDHMDTLDTKHALGLAYFAQTKYDNAIKDFNEVYEKRKVFLGAYHHDTLNVACDMANAYRRNNNHDEALKIFQDVYKKRKASFGENHPDTLQVQQDMAVVLVNKLDYKTAMQTFKDVLQKRKVVLGDDHPNTLLTEDHISIVSEKFESELKESNECLIM